MNLTDVINFILTTENIEDIPAIMDACTERVATELGVVAEPIAEENTTEMPTEVPAEETAQSNEADLSQFSL